jgi:hypothetical protein
MPSQFSWVDFAEADRQQMLNVVQLFREQESRDELGIGTIRDAFADYFFPGTSTIQTRVRYMLFISWIYLDLERHQTSSDQIARRARQAEVKLIYALLDSEGPNKGVIGQDARDKLQRLPSSVYWSGLDAWGIRLFPGSQDQYHRFLGVFYQRQQHKGLLGAEADRELGLEAGSANWDPGVPSPPDGFPDQASLALRREEAQYLQERIRLHHRGSLLAHLVTYSPLIKAGFFWDHPLVQQLPASLKQDICHAQNFSEVIYGAALLYNLMLAQKSQQQELIDFYQARYNEWADHLESRWTDLIAWYHHLADFWSSPALRLARIPQLTHAFVEAWFKLVFDSGHNLKQLANQPAPQHLIHDREVQLKRTRARLENPRALERWAGYSGIRQLEYRWTIAHNFVADILTGLQSQER